MLEGDFMKRVLSSRFLVVLGIFAIAFAALLPAQQAKAEETILSYHSILDLQKSGDLTVTENIKVKTEGNQIRHGIYRDIPLTFTDDKGAIHHVGFKIISIQRDGGDEPFTTEFSDKGVRIEIGSGDVTLDPGIYTYQITFKTDRQVRFFNDYAELMWNVTGNGWAFPIEEATATIMLPKGVVVQDTAFYTGPVGAKGTYARVMQENGDVFFGTTHPLGVRHGLTVSIKLPKDAIDPPSFEQKLKWLWLDNINAMIACIGFLIVLGYYYWGWNKVGRDPPRGVMVPRWDPPESISPALVSYIDNKGFGSNAWTALSSSALNLAVKGLITLEDLDSQVTFKRTEMALPAKLPDGENVIMNALGAPGSTFQVIKANGVSVKKLGEDFRSSIENEHRGEFYKSNAGYTFNGIVLTILVAAALFLFGSLTEDAVFTVFMGAIISVLVAGFAVIAGHTFFARSSIVMKIFAIIVLAVIALLFLTVTAGTLSTLIVTFEKGSDLYLLGGVAGILLSNILFFYLMGAPTPLGTKMMDGIDGLRQYMTLAETNRMNLAGAPSMSPQHFEKLLPYAVALGVEKPWSNHFQAWLATAAAAGVASSYSPMWYYGDSDNYLGFSDRISDFSGSIADSLASSLPDPPPSSSDSSFSGGGGGGFSGGGGGGGGGGGW